MDNTIKPLKSYAARHIVRLAEIDKILQPLAQLVVERFSLVESEGEIITENQAEKYINVPGKPEDFPGNNFDKQTLKDCYEIAVETLEIAADPSSKNEHMVKVARYLHPLFSLDNSTIMIGHDLEEYMDWYFADDIPTKERQKYLKKMIDDWEYLRIEAHT